MFQLFKIGTYRKVAFRHNGPPSWSCPGPLQRGEKEVRENLGFQLLNLTGGLGPLRGQAAPCAPLPVYIHFRNGLEKNSTTCSVLVR